MNNIIGRRPVIYPFVLIDECIDTEHLTGVKESYLHADVIVTSDGVGFTIPQHGIKYRVEDFNIGWCIVGRWRKS